MTQYTHSGDYNINGSQDKTGLVNILINELGISDMFSYSLTLSLTYITYSFCIVTMGVREAIECDRKSVADHS